MHSNFFFLKKTIGALNCGLFIECLYLKIAAQVFPFHNNYGFNRPILNIVYIIYHFSY